MTFILTATDGQSYLVHTEVGGDHTTKVIVEPVPPVPTNQGVPA